MLGIPERHVPGKADTRRVAALLALIRPAGVRGAPEHSRAKLGAVRPWGESWRDFRPKQSK